MFGDSGSGWATHQVSGIRSEESVVSFPSDGRLYLSLRVLVQKNVEGQTRLHQGSFDPVRAIVDGQ